MKLKQQVTSLALSKELKEAGYKQEGLWWWFLNDDTQIPYVAWSPVVFGHKVLCIAPTVTELGRDLKMCRFWWKPYLNPKEPWHADLPGRNPHVENANTEANLRAKMWLYLKKEGKLC